MQRPDSIRSPRDVLRWIAAEAIGSGVEIHAGLEVGVAGMVRPPVSGDQGDIERYMRENEKIEAAVKRLGWLEYGPFADKESYVVTDAGEEALFAIASFDEGIRSADGLLALELESRARAFAGAVRTANQEAAAAGAINSGRARLHVRGLVSIELVERRRALIGLARQIADRVGGRRLDASETDALVERVVSLLRQAIDDLASTLFASTDSTPSEPDVLAAEAQKLRLALRDALSRPGHFPASAGGDTFNIQADGSQVNAGGTGNSAVMVQELPADLLQRVRDLEAELLQLGAETLAESVRELRALAKRGEVPRSLWKSLLAQIGGGAKLAGTAEGAFALSERAAEAIDAIQKFIEASP